MFISMSTIEDTYILCTTVLPAKSGSDVMVCLQLFSKTLTCTHHVS